MTRASSTVVVSLLSCLAPMFFASDARALPAPGGRRVALLFAVADYRNISDLRLTVKDAQDLGAVLQQLGFEVRLVTDGTDPKASTAALIDQTLQQYAFATGPDDVFLFYFSGHGFSLIGQGGTRDYICPSEMTADPSTGFPIERARSILLDQRCQAGQRIVIVDACRSLSGVEIPGRADPLGGLQQLKLLSTQNLTVLAGTNPGSVSTEIAGKTRDADGIEINNGVFTHFLMKSLSPQGDVNRDGVLTFQEVGATVARQMLDFSFQNPERYQIPYWDPQIKDANTEIASFAARGLDPETQLLTEIRALLRGSPDGIERALVDKITASSYHSDPAVKTQYDQVIATIISENVRTEQNLDATLRLLSACVRIDGAGVGAIRALAVGAEPGQLMSRIALLESVADQAKLLGGTGAKAYGSEIERLVLPYVRRAAELQRLDEIQRALDLCVQRCGSSQQCLDEVQDSLERLILMGRRQWADELLAGLRERGLRPAFVSSIQSIDEGAIAWHLDRLARLGRGLELDLARGNVIALIARRTDASDLQRLAGLVDAVGQLPAETALVQELRAKLAPMALEIVTNAAVKASDADSIAKVLDLVAVAKKIGVSPMDLRAVVSGSGPMWLRATISTLPAVGGEQAAFEAGLARVVALVEASDSDLRREAAGEFRKRWREAFFNPSVRVEAVLREFDAAARFGDAKDSLAEDLIDPARNTPRDAAEVEREMIVLREVQRLQGGTAALGQAAQRLAAAAVTLGAVEAIALAVVDDGVLTKDAVLFGVVVMPGREAGDILPRNLVDGASKSIGSVLASADPAIALKAARTAVDMHAQLVPRCKSAGLTLAIDPRAVAGALTTAAKGASLSECDLVLERAADSGVATRNDLLPALAQTVASTPGSDASALNKRVDRLLAWTGNGEIPKSCAGRVAESLESRGDWQGVQRALLALDKGQLPELRARVKSILDLRACLTRASGGDATQGILIPVMARAKFLVGPFAGKDGAIVFRSHISLNDWSGASISGKRVLEGRAQSDATLELGAMLRVNAVSNSRTDFDLANIDFPVTPMTLPRSGLRVLTAKPKIAGQDDTEVILVLPDNKAIALEACRSLSAMLDRALGNKQPPVESALRGEGLVELPLVLDDRNDLEFNVAAAVADGPRELVFDLVPFISDSKVRTSWETAQRKIRSNDRRAKDVARFVVKVGTDQEEVVVELPLDFKRVETRISVPQGTSSVTIDCVGSWPAKQMFALEAPRLIRK